MVKRALQLSASKDIGNNLVLLNISCSYCSQMLLSVGLCSFTCMQPVFIRLSATDNLQQDCLRLFLFFF